MTTLSAIKAILAVQKEIIAWWLPYSSNCGITTDNLLWWTLCFINRNAVSDAEVLLKMDLLLLHPIKNGGRRGSPGVGFVSKHHSTSAGNENRLNLHEATVKSVMWPSISLSVHKYHTPAVKYWLAHVASVMHVNSQVYVFILSGWRKHTLARWRRVFRPLPWKLPLNNHGSLCWAVACPPGLGLFNAHHHRGQVKCKAPPQLLDQFIVNTCEPQRTSRWEKKKKTLHMHAHLILTLLAGLYGVRSNHGHWAVWRVTKTLDGLFPHFGGEYWLSGHF